MSAAIAYLAVGPLPIMRNAALILVAFCTLASANPLPLSQNKDGHLYLASEALAIHISPETATINGTLHFKRRQNVPGSEDGAPAGLQIPIWFPEQDPQDPRIAAFWQRFPQDSVINLTPESRKELEQALALRVSLGDQIVKVAAVSTLTARNPTQCWAPREWQVPGWCCVVLQFDFKDDSSLVEKGLAISYRHPLLRNDQEKFYYLPVLKDLPKGTDMGRYSITVIPERGCALEVCNGDEQVTIRSGGAKLTPRHHVPIMVFIRSKAYNPNINYALYEFREFRVTGSRSQRLKQLEELHTAGWTEEPGVLYVAEDDPGYLDVSMMRPKKK